MSGGPYLKDLLYSEDVDTVFSSIFVRLKSLRNNYGIHESRAQECTLICCVLSQGNLLSESQQCSLALSIG